MTLLPSHVKLLYTLRMGSSQQFHSRGSGLVTIASLIVTALLIAVSVNQSKQLKVLQDLQVDAESTHQALKVELLKAQNFSSKLIELVQQKPQHSSPVAALSATCPSYFTGMYMGSGKVICFNKPLGVPMLLEGADKGITPHLCRGYGWEPETSAVFRRLIKPGYHVLDVGTNIGYFTVMYAQLVGIAGHVMGIEASPRTFDLVSTTLEINGYSTTCKVINRAVYDADGQTVHISIARDRSLNNKVIASGTGSRAETAPVSTITIDTAVADWSKLDFIKIDVEGAEQLAYHGMRKTLSRFPNVVVIMEVNTIRMGVDRAQKFYQELQNDYPQLYRLVGDRIVSTSSAELFANRHGDDMVVLTKRTDILAI